MGLAPLLCLLLVFTLHLNIFNFQRMNVGVFLGFRRVSEGFPEVCCKFSWVSAGFPKGFRRVFHILCGFPWFCMGFCMVSAEFRRFRAVFKLQKVSHGFCRFPWVQLCLEGLPSLKSKSSRKVITVVVRRCAKSYIFVGTISGARKRWNFATVLRGASTVVGAKNSFKFEAKNGFKLEAVFDVKI